MDQRAMEWQAYGEALAFCGNSLLSPMSMTGDVGLNPAFWEGFPDFGDEGVARAVGACREFAEKAQARAADGADAVQDASVEFAKLFVGPPKPAAPPWESLYGPGGARGEVGFGKATVEMRRRLAAAGLEVSNENNQYADHIGIELLYAAAMCERLSAGEIGDADEQALRFDNFIGDHPLGWIGDLRQAVMDVAPDGYYVGILILAEALLLSLSQRLRT